MYLLIRFFIGLFLILGGTHVVAFASSVGTIADAVNIDQGAIVEDEDIEKIKESMKEYILASYKSQATKVLKDLDTKLQKALPDREVRKEAYVIIRQSLNIRLKNARQLDASPIKREILSAFIEYMIRDIDLRIRELEK